MRLPATGGGALLDGATSNASMTIQVLVDSGRFEEFDGDAHASHHHDGLAEESTENLTEEELRELIADFHDLDILEETKTFRWYHNNRPADRFKNLRLGLRRWIANSWARRTE